jgi:hypothetical protein
MANTFELIASSTVGAGGAASIDFTSIPSTYTDLCLQLSLRSDAVVNYGVSVKLVFNSSTTAVYSTKRIEGYDSSAGSNGTSALGYLDSGLTCTDNDTASTFGLSTIYIPNYAGSSNKSASSEYVVERNSATKWDIGFQANLWANTAAINSIGITASSGNWKQYSTAYLYGVKNA